MQVRAAWGSGGSAPCSKVRPGWDTHTHGPLGAVLTPPICINTANPYGTWVLTPGPHQWPRPGTHSGIHCLLGLHLLLPHAHTKALCLLPHLAPSSLLPRPLSVIQDSRAPNPPPMVEKGAKGMLVSIGTRLQRGGGGMSTVHPFWGLLSAAGPNRRA